MEDFEVDVEVKQTYRISVKAKTIEEAKELARINALNGLNVKNKSKKSIGLCYAFSNKEE